MQEELLLYLRCPVTQQPLSLRVFSKCIKKFDGIDVEIIYEGVLVGEVFCYPIIKGIPRLLIMRIFC